MTKFTFGFLLLSFFICKYDLAPDLPDVAAAIAAHVHLVIQLAHELGREDGPGQRLRHGVQPAQRHRSRQHAQPRHRLQVALHRLLVTQQGEFIP